MNTKRQTIWLVSMLSLMVVLSAYYLFTQDTSDNKALTDNGNPKGEVTEVAGENDKTIVNNDELNEEILAKIEREGILQGGIFDNLQTKRDQYLDSEYDRILSSITNSGESNEEVTAAFAELQKFEDNASKIKSLEDKLMEKYDVAHIDQTEDVLNIVVSSSNMNKSEAAEIIEEVMTVPTTCIIIIISGCKIDTVTMLPMEASSVSNSGTMASIN